jgi:hypothetical protein
MSHYGFIDPERVLRDKYQPIQVNKPTGPLEAPGSRGVYTKKTTQQLENMLYVKEYMSILLSPTIGYVTKFYTDEEIQKIMADNDDELPMDIDGQVIVFYNVEDACRILGLK